MKYIDIIKHTKTYQGVLNIACHVTLTLPSAVCTEIAIHGANTSRNHCRRRSIITWTENIFHGTIRVFHVYVTQFLRRFLRRAKKIHSSFHKTHLFQWHTNCRSSNGCPRPV